MQQLAYRDHDSKPTTTQAPCAPVHVCNPRPSHAGYKGPPQTPPSCCGGVVFHSTQCTSVHLCNDSPLANRQPRTLARHANTHTRRHPVSNRGTPRVPQPPLNHTHFCDGRASSSRPMGTSLLRERDAGQGPEALGPPQPHHWRVGLHKRQLLAQTPSHHINPTPQPKHTAVTGPHTAVVLRNATDPAGAWEHRRRMAKLAQ
jgi:hypothetical protein